MSPITVRVQSADFDIAAEVDRLRRLSADVGAIVTFSGVCRADDGRLAALELEHYPGMAEGEMARIADEAVARWPLAGVTVVHRYGRIAVGENVVLVVTASTHRQAAFEAATFLMDFMKTKAPFWKKEHAADGTTTEWVASRHEDEAEAGRWKKRSDE